HAQVREYIEAHGMTMGDFVAQALDNELHPRIQEGNNMGTRTMAFQVPEELFQEIKDYLNRHHMKQKDFVLGLIRAELDRDQQQTESQEQAEVQDNGEAEYEDEALEDDEGFEEEAEESEDMAMNMG
ncbi:MAG: hypothetical protein II936_09080, partial [Oscillospiraceae bacterium]|nr:hypothetical protein [Oscillospiraceae bacterium]